MIVVTRKWKKMLKLSTLTMPQKPTPACCVWQSVAAIAATEPTSAIRPSIFWLRCSSTSGSSSIMIMPNIERTISGRMRIYSTPWGRI